MQTPSAADTRSRKRKIQAEETVPIANAKPRSRRRKVGNAGINWNGVLVSEDCAALSTDISGADTILEAGDSSEPIECSERELRERRVYAYLWLLQFTVAPYIQGATRRSS